MLKALLTASAALALPQNLDQFPQDNKNKKDQGVLEDHSTGLNKMCMPPLKGIAPKEGKNQRLKDDLEDEYKTSKKQKKRSRRGFDVKKQHAHKGYKVYDSGLWESIEADGSTVTKFQHVLDVPKDFNKKEQYSLADALSVCRAHNGHSEVEIEPREQETFVMWSDKDCEFKLIHLVSYFYPAGPLWPECFVDAENLAIEREVQNLQTEIVEITTRGGNQKVEMPHDGVSSRKVPVWYDSASNTCKMESDDVRVIDLNGGTNGGSVVTWQNCDQLNLDLGELPNHSGGRATIDHNGAYNPEADAMSYGTEMFAMFQEYVGEAPLSVQLTLRLHYSTGYENAFWDGQAMTFGDGLNTFYPLVSLDVAAHEVAHGFTEQKGGNMNYAGESGGMNEAFSDMAGEAAEYYARGANDFLTGSEIFKQSGGALRNLCNPTGSSIGSYSQYYNGLDVHYSSGIYNRAFCELAKNQHSPFPRWNTKSAFQMFAKANQLCWTQFSTMKAGAECVVAVTENEGWNAPDVQKAFAAVGINVGGGIGVMESLGQATIGNLRRGQSVSVTIPVPQATDALVVQTSGGSGDLDLYISTTSNPNIASSGACSSCLCSSFTASNSEYCSVPANAGNIFAIVKAYSSVAGGPVLTAAYMLPPEEPNEPVSDLSGNGMSCTDSMQCESQNCFGGICVDIPPEPTTSEPTTAPTTSQPTSQPTNQPTSEPTTSEPTATPTTSQPTSQPTNQPTSEPTTSEPTAAPTTTQPTTSEPTPQPSINICDLCSTLTKAECQQDCGVVCRWRSRLGVCRAR